VEFLTIQPEPVESTQGTIRAPSTTRTPNLKTTKKKRRGNKVWESQNVALVENKTLEDNVEKLVKEPGSHKENPEELVNDDDKNDDEKNDDHKTLIPSPPRSIRTNLSSDKAPVKELTDTNVPMLDAPSQTTSSHHTHLKGIVSRMSRRQGHMMQQIKKAFVSNNYLRKIIDKVDETLKEVIPKIATSATNELMKYNLSWLMVDVVKKESEQSKDKVLALIS
nr:hypothetical protein [Tanacetum cinerariifolium]